jgi:hypothetical protein
MSIIFNESAIPGRHNISYRVRDAVQGFPTRTVEVLATADELAQFNRDGYLLRERLLPQETIDELRSALDETVAQDQRLETGNKSFGGTFIRHLIDKHPSFLGLLHFAPTLSIARAMFGPYVQIRGTTGRVCYPDDPNQETEWHFHQRLIPDPIPAWFVRPQTLDVLIYLDDITDLNGPLCVIPGSHQWIERDQPTNDFADHPDQVVLRLPAGSAVLTHGALWHRAMPTQPGGTIRRLLILGYGPAWIKPAIYGERPADGLTNDLRASGDRETRELLGLDGYM